MAYTNTEMTNSSTDKNLFTEFYGYLAQFIEGDIDEMEISDLIDLNIELSNEYA